jgi:selenocysteine lyase/cysteine desulfurase
MNEHATTIDIEAVRADTPAVEQIVHLNNCGTSLPPQPVMDAMIDYLQLEASVGGYEAMDVGAAGLDRVYTAGAELLGCRPEELAFATGASEAWWRAFLSVPLVPGDRVLIGRTEYIANALALIQAADRGISVEVVPDDDTGQIDVRALENMMDRRVKLVCLTSIAMTNGLVNPAAEVGAVAKAAGAYYLIDACQAVGQIPVNVEDLQCDFLSFTGRKFVRGPRGSGMLYVRSSILDELVPPTFIDGRSANWTENRRYQLQPTAQRFELFECSFGAKVGFGRALDYALDLGLEAIDQRVATLADQLRASLDELPGVRVLDTGIRKCGIVTFDVAGHAAADVSAALGAKGINTGSPDLSGSRYDVESRSVPAVVRAGVHYFNTEDELDRLVTEVAALGS